MTKIRRIQHLKTALSFLIGLGVFVLIIMFIRFNSIVAENAADTKRIVQSQSEILTAIKTQAVDNKVSSEEKTAIIICMLQVDIDQRTTDLLTKCRKNAQSGGNGITAPPSKTAAPQTQTQQSVAPQTKTPGKANPPAQSKSILNSTTDRIKGLLRKVL